MTALSAAYAQLTQRTLFKQWFVFLGAIPVAMAGNVARIDGDGENVAATVGRGLAVFGWGGADPRTIEGSGNTGMPSWRADGLFYFLGSSTEEGELAVMHIPEPGAEPVEVCHISMAANPEFADFEPTTRQLSYTLERVEADIYLAQPATGRDLH